MLMCVYKKANNFTFMYKRLCMLHVHVHTLHTHGTNTQYTRVQKRSYDSMCYVHTCTPCVRLLCGWFVCTGWMSLMGILPAWQPS